MDKVLTSLPQARDLVGVGGVSTGKGGGLAAEKLSMALITNSLVRLAQG